MNDFRDEMKLFNTWIRSYRTQWTDEEFDIAWESWMVSSKTAYEEGRNDEKAIQEVFPSELAASRNNEDNKERR